jgi:hypothetical protein
MTWAFNGNNGSGIYNKETGAFFVGRMFNSISRQKVPSCMLMIMILMAFDINGNNDSDMDNKKIGAFFVARILTVFRCKKCPLAH